MKSATILNYRHACTSTVTKEKFHKFLLALFDFFVFRFCECVFINLSAWKRGPFWWLFCSRRFILFSCSRCMVIRKMDAKKLGAHTVFLHCFFLAKVGALCFPALRSSFTRSSSGNLNSFYKHFSFSIRSFQMVGYALQFYLAVGTFPVRLLLH